MAIASFNKVIGDLQRKRDEQQSSWAVAPAQNIQANQHAGTIHDASPLTPEKRFKRDQEEDKLRYQQAVKENRNWYIDSHYEMIYINKNNNNPADHTSVVNNTSNNTANNSNNTDNPKSLWQSFLGFFTNK